MRPTFVLASLVATLVCLPLTCSAQSAKPPAVPTLLAPAFTPSPVLQGTNDSDHPSLNRPNLETWLDGYLPYALARANIPGAVWALTGLFVARSA